MIGGKEYTYLQKRHMLTMRALDVITVNAWSHFKALPDGIHPDTTTTLLAGLKIQEAIYQD